MSGRQPGAAPSGAVLEHDGSFPGLLCACAEAMNAPEPVPRVLSRGEEPGLFDDRLAVRRDDGRAAALWDRFAARVGRAPLRTVLSAFLSGAAGVDSSIAVALRRVWSEGPDALSDFGDDDVTAVAKAAYRAGAEAHRFLGIVRFSELSDGSWYAPVEPRCDVLLLMADHFAARYAPMRFALHDTARGSAIVHEAGGPWTLVDGFSIGPGGLESLLSEGEEETRRLWRLYFETIAIEERRNPRQQRTMLPKRFWAGLTEFRDSDSTVY